MLFQPRTLDDHADSLAHYLPGGEMFEARFLTDTNLRHFLRALAAELLRLQSVLEDTATELDLRYTQMLINEWENAFGIPQTCFADYTYNLADRRMHLLMMINELHGTTADDFVNLAAKLGYTVRIETAKPHGLFPAQFPIYFFPNGKSAKFTMIVHLPPDGALAGFPLKFPIQFRNADNQLLRCLFNRMKPANVQIFYVFDQV